MKKSRSTRSHFTHARSCCARSIEFTRVRNDRPSIRTYSSWKGDTFPFVRFTGYKESNQNQFGRVLRFAFALTCYKTYLFFSSLSDFDSCSWREHLSYGVCRLRARVLLKTLSSLLNAKFMKYWGRSLNGHSRKWTTLLTTALTKPPLNSHTNSVCTYSRKPMFS